MPIIPNLTKKKLFWVMLFLWALSHVVFSSKTIRGLAALPLYVDDVPIRASYAYVMADGHSYWERLRTASDLYHLHQVDKLLLREELENSRFNFIKGRSDKLVERAIDYLGLHGVPPDAIETVPIYGPSQFGSFSEAEAVARRYPKLESIVVVTSAPHTRRSKLCFERCFAENVRVCMVAASVPSDSSEINEPLWVEYIKLVIYGVFAR